MFQQPNSPSLPEGVARSLRHEVGDLLQTVYAAVAVLKERLPPDWSLERGILVDLRARAERTRDLLDLVHDLVTPLTINPSVVDLSELLTGLTAKAALRHSDREFRTETVPTQPFPGDVKRLSQLGNLLLDFAARKGGRLVRVKVKVDSPGVEWHILTDENAIPPDNLELMKTPFTRPSHDSARLALALACRLADLQGCGFAATNLSGGGFEFRVTFATDAPGRTDSKPK